MIDGRVFIYNRIVIHSFLVIKIYSTIGIIHSHNALIESLLSFLLWQGIQCSCANYTVLEVLDHKMQRLIPLLLLFLKVLIGSSSWINSILVNGALLQRLKLILVCLVTILHTIGFSEF